MTTTPFPKLHFDHENGGDYARIFVDTPDPETITIDLEVDDPAYSFANMQSMPVAEFLAKLGLHREAAAAEMLAFVRNYADNSECDALGCLAAGNSRVLCGHCQAAALVERTAKGAAL